LALEELMKISSQEEYGLRCLLCLVRAEDSGHAPTIPEIAASEGLSAPYVAKLLAVLRHGGIVESARGRTGGYHLATPAGQVSLGKVLMVLGEPLFDEPNFCERHKGSETDGECVHLGDCNLRAVWQTLETWMRGALDQITLADLVQSEGQITDLLRRKLVQAMQTPGPADLVPLTVLSTQ
jgi:Rrf2 family protein